MPRKGNVPKREVLPDPVYGSVVVAKLINSIMLDGKKGTAQQIVYSAFDMIEKQTGEEPMEVFNFPLVRRRRGRAVIPARLRIPYYIYSTPF